MLGEGLDEATISKFTKIDIEKVKDIIKKHLKYKENHRNNNSTAKKQCQPLPEIPHIFTHMPPHTC